MSDGKKPLDETAVTESTEEAKDIPQIDENQPLSDQDPRIDGEAPNVEVIDGKATPTEESVRRIERIQQMPPDVQTTSEPTDPPAAELQEQAARETEAKADAPPAPATKSTTPPAAPTSPAPPVTKSESTKSAKTPAETPAPAEPAAKSAAPRKAPPPKAKAAAEADAAPAEPSPRQPELDRIVRIMREEVAADAVEDAYINDKDGDLPCLIISGKHWLACATLLKQHEDLQLTYLRNLSGVDQETHLEVVYHLLNMNTKQECCIKVKTDREQPSIPSAAPIWSMANWNEREVFDLFGIDFPGHPDLRRIMMPDDWEGYPLRKDYEPIDPEV